MLANPLFQSYRTTIDGRDCYVAGLPGYPRNFSRDTFIAGVIAADKHLIKSQIIMSSLHQGKRYNRLNGEEPGKIHHEFPGVVVHKPHFSTYNACDTTALYLISLEFLEHLDHQAYQMYRETYAPNIRSAIKYLERHIKDDIFWEFPPAGGRHFSLHTTYWKDSIVPRAGKTEPEYPVAYALVQFQVARGLLAASRILDEPEFAAAADRMFRKAIAVFMGETAFCVEQDEDGRLEQPSSDELHALAYIPLAYRGLLPLRAIAARAKPLITHVGIACTPHDISQHMDDTYHGYVVWIFEQAMIHYGCHKFVLDQLAGTALRCRPYIHEGNELLAVHPSGKSIGNNHQLWSEAAKLYFSDGHSLRKTGWL